MKNLLRYFNKISWQSTVLILFLFLMSVSTLFINWSILDDGVTVMVSQNISKGIKTLDFNFVTSTLIETGTGRFRPFYWVFNWLIYSVGGINVHFFFIVHCALFVFSSIVIYKIVGSVSKNKTAALIGSLFFAANSLNMENWFRLGPIEPIFGALISGVIYALFLVYKGRHIKSASIVAYILVLLTFLTKETSVVLVPLFGLVYVFSRYALPIKNQSYIRLLRRLLLLSVVLGIIVIPTILYLRGVGDYSSSYQSSVRVIVGHFFSYLKSISFSIYPIFWIVLGYFILRNIHLYLMEKKVLTELYYWQLFCLLLFLLLLGIQLPWEFPLNRYLLPALVPFSIFWGLEVDGITKISFLRKHTTFLLIGYFILFTYGNVFHLANYFLSTYKGTIATSVVLKYIADTSPDRTVIKFNAKEGDDTIEAKYESGYHLRYFYNRPDLSVDYLTEVSRVPPKNNIVIISAFIPKQRKVISDDDLAKIKWLKLVKIYNFSVPQFEFYPLNSIFSDILLFKPFKNKLVAVTFVNQSWLVYSNN